LEVGPDDRTTSTLAAARSAIAIGPAISPAASNALTALPDLDVATRLPLFIGLHSTGSRRLS
jgi:hypothetical protein